MISAGPSAGDLSGTSSAGPRVLNLCRVLWNGGVQRAAIGQTLELRRRGIRCDLLFLRRVAGTSYDLPEGTRVGPERSPGNDSVLGELSQSITARFAGHRGEEASVDLDRLWQARSVVGQYNVTIYNDQYAGLLGLWMRARHHRPFILMFHEFYPQVERGPRAALLALIASAWDHIAILTAPAIVTTSSRVRDRIEDFAPGRTLLARLGAPPVPPRAPVEERDRRSVFSITVWDRGRHPELFLDLARELPEFSFTVAGMWTDPNHLAEFRRAAASLHNVTVTGVISEAERARRQHGALVYLRFGYGESGPGMGGMEALADGSVVLVNGGLGLSELIDDGRNGFVVPSDDVAAVVATLRRIDRFDVRQLQAISDAARGLAGEVSWPAHGDRLEQALRLAMTHMGGRQWASGSDIRADPSPRPKVREHP